MERKIIISILVAFFPLLLWSQDTEQAKKDLYKPKFFGLMKSKFEYDFDQKDSRFALRNARIGATGKASEMISYKLQYELNDNGKSCLLDAYAGVNLHKGLVVWVGQQSILFSEDHILSPSQNILTEADYLTRFVGPGARDLGAVVDYILDTKIAPIQFQFGVFNGNGINKAEWDDNPFYSARITVGQMQGFRGSVKYYGGKNKDATHAANRIHYYGVDLRYATDAFRIDGTWNTQKIKDVDYNLSGLFLLAAYKLPIVFKETCKLKYIEPSARWDAMGYEMFDDGLAVNRATFGLNFGFDVKKLVTEVRVNYENVFTKNNFDTEIYFGADARAVNDKIMLELLIKF